MKIDKYAIKAQLWPGLLIIIPIITNIYIVHPGIIESKIASAILHICLSCGLLFLISNFARSRGKAKERELLRKWGGWPTTIMLRHGGPLDQVTLARYHQFLKKNIPGWGLPTSDQQRDNPSHADAAYNSAVIWLKEKTRSGFPLIITENINYGFRRNLYGIKRFALYVYVILFSINVIIASNYIWTVSAIQQITVIIISPSLTIYDFVVICVFYMIAITCLVFIVTSAWVREAGDQYARALLAACDTFISSPRAKQPSPRD